jgi:WD40 repeat protein
LANHNLCLWTQQQQDEESHNKVVFSPTGDVFANFGNIFQPSLHLRNTSDGSLSQTIRSQIEFKCAVVLSPDGRKLAICGGQNAIELWNLDDPGSTAAILDGHDCSVRDISYSPDGNFLASAAHDRTIKLWDVASQLCTQTMTGHTNALTSLSFSPNGKFIASGSVDHEIRVWSMANGNCVETVKAVGNITFVGFSQDGKMLLTKEGEIGEEVFRWRYVNPGHA